MAWPTIIFNTLASIGGISGIIGLANWLKSRKAKVKILSSHAEYYVDKGDLIILTKLQITNERNEPVFITDVLGLIKHSPTRTKNRKGKVYSMRPNQPVVSPTRIEEKSTVELTFRINFGKVDPQPITRIGLMNLLGFSER